MKILVDTHTHTNASTHAFSTLEENIRRAAEIGLEAIAITNHAPGMPDSPHIWHFDCLPMIPREMNGVKVLYGVEADVLDADGSLDMPPSVLSKLDVVIVSMHHDTFPPQNKAVHTRAYINALKNPYVDIIGHSGSPEYEYDITAVLSAAKKEGKMIEINNNSHLVRRHSIGNCVKIANKCKEMGVYVVVSSDSHISSSVGDFNEAKKLLEEISFPEELIANASLEKFLEILRRRKLVGGI